jgi:hypothetical protein
MRLRQRRPPKRNAGMRGNWGEANNQQREETYINTAYRKNVVAENILKK